MAWCNVLISDKLASSVVNVYGGKFEGAFETIQEGKIEISGGSFSDDPTSYLADGYSVTNTGDSDYPFVVIKE